MALPLSSSYNTPLMLSNHMLAQVPPISSAALLYGQRLPSYSSPPYEVTSSWPPYLSLASSIPSQYLHAQSLASSIATSLPYRPALIPPTSDLSMPIASSHMPAMMMPSPIFYPQVTLPAQDGSYPPFIPFTSGDYDIPEAQSINLASFLSVVSQDGHVDHYAALAAMLHEASMSPPTSSSSARPSSSASPPSIDGRTNQIVKSSLSHSGRDKAPWPAQLDRRGLQEAHRRTQQRRRCTRDGQDHRHSSVHRL